LETILPNLALADRFYKWGSRIGNSRNFRPLSSSSRIAPMSIRFAAPRSSCRVRMIPASVRASLPFAANDNARNRDDKAPGNAHLSAALRHFARHGIAAAQHAREQAIAAGHAGDRQTFEWWLDICRALDRRMASAITAADKAEAC
jgi:hypothetical protein